MTTTPSPAAVLEYEAFLQERFPNEEKDTTTEHASKAIRRPIAAIVFYESPEISEMIMTGHIHKIRKDFSDPQEHRITVMHGVGIIEIIGQTLETLARDLQSLKLAEVRTGTLTDGTGKVARIVLG